MVGLAAPVGSVGHLDRSASETVTHSRPDIRELLARADTGPKKSLGQNFVVDPNTVRRIAGLAGVQSGSKVVEIGAGLGSLTLALIETGAEVLAVETDPALVPILREVVGDRAEVVQADARRVDWAALLDGGPWTLVANLPYNIATSLVLDILDDVPQVERLLVMVQREAGERMAASAGDPAYGAVSVRVAMRGEASLVGTVPPTVFHPQPKVTSTLVAIDRVDRGLPAEIDAKMIDLLRVGFGQRRKMLRRSLGALVDDVAFAAAGVESTRRPEELGLREWHDLATAVCQGEADG